jgi:acyl dehydratase
MRVDEQRYFESVRVGDSLQLTKGPIREVHVMRWSAAMENWHRIHFDWKFAVEHDRLPGIMVNGSWKQHVLAQLLKDWAGLGGWTWKLKFQYRAMDLPGDLIRAWGTVRETRELEGMGFVSLDVGITNSRNVESTRGEAVVVLPKRGGPPLPYPFVTPELRGAGA